MLQIINQVSHDPGVKRWLGKHKSELAGRHSEYVPQMKRVLGMYKSELAGRHGELLSVLVRDKSDADEELVQCSDVGDRVMQIMSHVSTVLPAVRVDRHSGASPLRYQRLDGSRRADHVRPRVQHQRRRP